MPDNRALKAKETKNQNRNLQQIEDCTLIADVATSGGRAAKRNALLNPAWAADMKMKKVASKRKEPDAVDDEDERVYETQSQKKKRGRPKTGDEEEEVEQPVRKKPAGRKAPKVVEVQEGEEEDEVNHDESDEDLVVPPASGKASGKAVNKATPKAAGSKANTKVKATPKAKSPLSSSSDEDNPDNEMDVDGGEDDRTASQSSEEEDFEDMADKELEMLLDGPLVMNPMANMKNLKPRGKVILDDDDDLPLLPAPVKTQKRKKPRVKDDEDDDLIPPPTQRERSPASSLVESVPGTSDYDADLATEVDDALAEDVHPLSLRHKSTVKKPRLRDIAFRAKQPVIIENSTRENKQHPVLVNWPMHARLVHPSDRGTIRKREQRPTIRHLLSKTIQYETLRLLTHSAWPEYQRRDAFRQEVMLNGATWHLQVPGMSDIKARVESDMEFAEKLANVVLDRFATTRNPAKTQAAAYIAVYQLGYEHVCKLRVARLLEKNRIWVINRKKPYLNPAIIQTLKTGFFQSSTSIGYKAVTHYTKDHKLSAPQIPISMLALAATAIYATLMDWQEGIRYAKNFDGNLYAPTYQYHVESLETVRDIAPVAFCTLMNELYESVCSQATAVPVASGRRLNPVMDLSGYTEEN